ncbi:MAG: tol-pal system-associated acyl-CoA thioesterase [bacterium]
MKYSHPVQVYYEDTDAGGVVYHAQYLNFMERARTEALRSLGYQLDELTEQRDLVFVVRRAQVDYLSPARFNEALQVTADFSARGKTSWVIDQQVVRVNDDVVLAEGRIVIVAVNTKTMRPMRIPQDIVESMKHAK